MIAPHVPKYSSDIDKAGSLSAAQDWGRWLLSSETPPPPPPFSQGLGHIDGVHSFQKRV